MKYLNVYNVNSEIVLQGECGENVKLIFTEESNEEVVQVILDILLMSYEERIAKNGNNLTGTSK